ncbi:hypothetical protein B9Z55_021612 [Caenorhabditis nigoni]|nr:hypothetical protein B9Z55_021612 [Caenorhabditis nigoni]
MAFLKLAPMAEKVEVRKNIFDSETDISKFLALNLNSVSFNDWRKPFELELNDLLVANIGNLSIQTANITEKKLNRFLKLWMKGNHTFYRPKSIELSFRNEMNREEVFKGIKCEAVPDDEYWGILKRRDGKKLIILPAGNFILIKFQRT